MSDPFIATLIAWYVAIGGEDAQKITGLSPSDIQQLYTLFTQGRFVELADTIKNMIERNDGNDPSQKSFNIVVADVNIVANYLVSIVNDIDDLVLILSALVIVALKGIPLTLMYKAGIMALNYL